MTIGQVGRRLQMAGGDVGSVVIVGAGQAGFQAAQTLRRLGFAGRLTLVGEEAFPPYQRPPLSKAFLKGEMAEDRLAVKPEAFYAEQDIRLLLSTRVTAIDRATRTVLLRDGGALAYDRLILATGSRPRPLPLPGAALENVLELRGLDDAHRLARLLTSCRSLAVVGGGYIGLETAATARHHGLAVTVLERMPRLLARVTSPVVGEFICGLHTRQGVDIRCDARLVRLEGDGGRVARAVLEDGETIPADLVLVGIGVLPNAELAAEAGLAVDNGILVDAHGLTDDPHIYAIGDCSRHGVQGYTGLVRLESVHNALDQGERAARHIVGSPPPPFDPPWFWSDQYHVKLQTVGLFNDYTDVVLRGDPATERFSAFYYRGAELIAVDSLNDPPSFMAAKQFLKQGLSVPPEIARDPTASLKQILAGHKVKEGAP